MRVTSATTDVFKKLIGDVEKGLTGAQTVVNDLQVQDEEFMVESSVSWVNEVRAQ